MHYVNSLIRMSNSYKLLLVPFDVDVINKFVLNKVSTWRKQYRASETHQIEAMENLLSWLEKNIPPGSMQKTGDNPLHLNKLTNKHHLT